MAVIVWGARTRRWDGHHVRDRQGRVIPFIALIGFSGIGLALLIILGAPRMLIALDIAMIGCLIVCAVITVWWKVSMYTATSAGAVVILVLAYTPWLWLSGLIVAAIAWSRVQLGDHTLAQVLGGIAAGSVLAVVFGLLTP
ncbi:hypothetical protein EV191_11586 [Tamaricihabitans halophyticus]|uniref:PAP2 superfamily protein n=1 Tax=Tamaricihabitans halophyticus TaxID=1262583 RepID=A0A4V2SS92_9PSEU|nr:hypothetical protein EV191_11586 [Tamaricihabitans halophyticus]